VTVEARGATSPEEEATADEIAVGSAGATADEIAVALLDVSLAQGGRQWLRRWMVLPERG
jgi:hypothetical protein